MSTFQKIDSKNYYNSLSDKALFRTFFHTEEWEDFLEKEFSWLKFERYIYNDELLLSIARCRIAGKEKLVSHPFCEYGGPLPLKEKIDFGDFLHNFMDEFTGSARLQFHPYIFRYNRGVTSIPEGSDLERLSFWIDDFSGKDEEALWNGFRKTLRQEIKKSESAEISICEASGEEEVRDFYNLYLSTIKRHKNIPLPMSVFRFFASGQGDNAKIFLAKKGGRVIGGSVFLFYKPFIHYFINAVDYRLREFNIGHRILWHVLKAYSGKRDGYDYFDLGGTRAGSSIEVFKRGWGSVAHPIYETGAKEGIKNNSVLRAVWGMVPNGMVSKFLHYALYFKV